MFRFWRGHRRTRTTIPIFHYSMRQTFWPTVLQIMAVPVLLLGALLWFGQPALRFQYWYFGSDANPVYQRCLYIAFDGWHWSFPNMAGQTGSACPIIKLMPVKFSDIL